MRNNDVKRKQWNKRPPAWYVARLEKRLQDFDTVRVIPTRTGIRVEGGEGEAIVSVFLNRLEVTIWSDGEYEVVGRRLGGVLNADLFARELPRWQAMCDDPLASPYP